LNAIIEEMKSDAEKMEEQANIIAQRKEKEEREKADRERDAQSGWRKKEEEEQMSMQSPALCCRGVLC
jgi:hypothetical protein